MDGPDDFSINDKMRNFGKADHCSLVAFIGLAATMVVEIGIGEE